MRKTAEVVAPGSTEEVPMSSRRGLPPRSVSGSPVKLRTSPSRIRLERAGRSAGQQRSTAGERSFYGPILQSESAWWGHMKEAEGAAKA
jgi:hypothetical protein